MIIIQLIEVIDKLVDILVIMASVKTRQSVEHSVFGIPQPLPTTQLPTSADVFRAYNYCLKFGSTSSLHKRSSVVAEEVKQVYSSASIPTIEFSSIVKRIERLVEKVKELGKYAGSRKSCTTYQAGLANFQTIFDVCTCCCFEKGVRKRSECICPLEHKISPLEWDFWLDQKTERRMFIGNVDKQATAMIKMKQARKRKRQKIIDNSELATSSNVCLSQGDDLEKCSLSENTEEESNEDEKVVLSDDGSSDNERVTVRNTKQYPELCKAVERSKVSNRDACLIANAVLKDMGLLTAENCIDAAKLRRQRKVWSQVEIERHAEETKQLVCIGFDGKQDTTLVMESKVSRRVKEEHYVIVSYPNATYVDHVMPNSSRASDVAKEIISVIKGTHSEESLLAVVCDGTVLNTGKHNGIIRQLEQSLRRPVQWLICLLHTNELPFRKYLSVLDDGCTTGPSTSTGEISSALIFDPEDLPLAEFQPISGKVLDVPDSVKKDLSSDQKYFLEACLAVQGVGGTESKKRLKTAMPGNVSHARWLTKANRILRLYMSKEHCNCHESLYKIAQFIVNVYAPSWFYIKQHSSCFEGAKNFFHLMQLCYKLGEDVWTIVEPVLKNNAYFAHPESILLAGVADDNCSVRHLACQRIIQARACALNNTIRMFDKDKLVLNKNATSFMDMISWNSVTITPPPLLSTISNVDLHKYSANSLQDIMCHSQQVERTVKDVSSTTCAVFGHASRHGMILQCNKSRKELPIIHSKSDFL